MALLGTENLLHYVKNKPYRYKKKTVQQNADKFTNATF